MLATGSVIEDDAPLVGGEEEELMSRREAESYTGLHYNTLRNYELGNTRGYPEVLTKIERRVRGVKMVFYRKSEVEKLTKIAQPEPRRAALKQPVTMAEALELVERLTAENDRLHSEIESYRELAQLWRDAARGK
jgi:hypothetical protein